ncbi:aminoacyl-tRNA deacylase [Galactobacter caseinivorans]|uniref:YbaK/aminoacyl-tRNA synthetase-associated domain-containing protein n=1 Tax=Galactobacter caseinivorans TaxID=2676123 RepID=A0A496PK05_9MICC|nr:YbaK/EbsC family protein [Galactobacter caseinivorans]RKW70832.1 hypothetical protein DWQ67_07000 [Galactobacter caseinivorans]
MSTNPQPAALPPGVEETAAIAAAIDSGVSFGVSTHGHVKSLEEAAEALGVIPRDVVKTLVVRRAEGEHLLVLVPGDRRFSWPKLRALLGENRLTMPDAAGAKDVTGFERGTITPFGTLTPLPVIADERMVGRTISLGAGAHGVGLTLAADDVLAHFGARVADLTDAPKD